MTVMSYAEVLKAARQLSLEDQVEITEALLRNLRFALQSKPIESRGELVPLSNMSLQELKTLAEAVVAPDRQQQLKALLDKNRRGELSPEEQATLDHLLAEVDQVGLLKARARYTIDIIGNKVLCHELHEFARNFRDNSCNSWQEKGWRLISDKV